jgi:hypothetical protein
MPDVRSQLSPAPSTRLSDEKAPVEMHESGKLYNPHVDVSGVDERKLLRKMDLHLVPWLSLLYLLSFLDRTSIGNAKVCCAWTSATFDRC